MANKGHANIIGKGFDKRPENINRKGRPRLTVKKLIEDVEKEGGIVLSRGDIEKLYSMLLDRTQDELTKTTNDKDASMVIRIVAKSMLGSRGFEIVEKMLDRANGRPSQIIGEDKNNKFNSISGLLKSVKDKL